MRVLFFINLRLLKFSLACSLVYVKTNEGTKKIHSRNGSTLYLKGITPYISAVIPSGAAWEPHLTENSRRRRHTGKKKQEVNAWKVRKNSLSIHQAWLKHACENNPTHDESQIAYQNKKVKQQHMLAILLFLWHFLSYIPFLHAAENPALCLLWFHTFSGQLFGFFLTLLGDLQHPGWMCLSDISKIYLVHQSLYFHWTPPTPPPPLTPFIICWMFYM